jgi:phenylpyruvate tautomerase PptA (4-oxalocrotonate tautomerase family)
MPYLRIQTNASVRKDQQESLLSQASQLVSRHLGNDEKFFMGIIENEQAIYFAGSSNPLAFLELKALGLPAEATKDLLHEELSITPERIYVRFHNVNRGMWGWNGGIF